MLSTLSQRLTRVPTRSIPITPSTYKSLNTTCISKPHNSSLNPHTHHYYTPPLHSLSTSLLLTTTKRFTALWTARKKASDAAAGGIEAGRHIAKILHRGQRWSSWSPDALVRLMGERRSQRGAKNQSAKANRHQWLWTYYTNVLRKQFHANMVYKKTNVNLSEWWSYDPRLAALQSDQLGPDAIYKYKPTPHHLKFRSFAVHPRPLESNLISGNEKTADKILPPDYMDKIFNQPDAGKLLSERFQETEVKLQYNIHQFRAMGFKQRILDRLFHVAMPREHESLSVANGYRRPFIGSNEVWVSGCWIDRREINDFFVWLALYTVGIPTIAITRAKFEGERLNGILIREMKSPLPTPLTQRTRLIQDSDRTTKAQFELIEPTPRAPLLD